MYQEQFSGGLSRLRHTVQSRDGTPTDGDLLRRFVQTRDAAAFELLVWRHGGMVLHTCRRLLGHAADADDAFQATFLLLVRQAGKIRRHEALGGWLHTVACRVSRHALM